MRYPTFFSRKTDYFQSSISQKNDFQINSNSGNEGDCQNSTCFKIEATLR